MRMRANAGSYSHAHAHSRVLGGQHQQCVPLLRHVRHHTRTRHAACRAGHSSSNPQTVCLPHSQLRLIRPAEAHGPVDKLLVYLPGTDGTGQAIAPQLAALLATGFDVYSLNVPPSDRSGWPELTQQVVELIEVLLARHGATSTQVAAHQQQQHHQLARFLEQQQALDQPALQGAAANGLPQDQAYRQRVREEQFHQFQLQQPPLQQRHPQVVIAGESFGGCLGLRVALAAPHLVRALALVNPATCFNRSLNGMSAFVSSTNLLGLFPEGLYSVAQTTLLPLLVNSQRLVPQGAELMRAMIEMTSVPSDTPLNGDGSPGPQPPVDDRPPLPPFGSEAYAALGGASDFLVSSAAAAAANFRSNLLREGDLPDDTLRGLRVPVLLLSSARDRLLPSIQEGARLQRVIQGAKRVILPDSGHAALLEWDVNLAVLLCNAFPELSSSHRTLGQPLPTQQSAPSQPTTPSPQPSPAGAALAGAAHASTSASTSSLQGSENTAAASPGGASSTQPLHSTHDGGGGGREGANGTGFDAAGSTSTSSSSTSASTNASSSGANSGAGTSRPWESAENWNGSSSSSSVRGGGTVRLPPPPVPRPSAALQDNTAFDEWIQILGPWRDLVSPVVLGGEHLPPLGSDASNRPMLFVGNHQRVGFYDTPLLVYELAVRGYRVRGLAHPGHWAGPIGPFFERFGAVKASPMAAFRLLRNNEKVLLFPGGAKEVSKPKGTDYKLLWKEEPDFVRLAAKCDAIIIPFAAVGADDAYDVMMDNKEILEHPVLGPAARSLIQAVDPSLNPQESLMPITRLPVLGIPSPIPVPNMNRLYFKFAPPIDTAQLKQNLKDASVTQQLYDHTRAVVEQCMADLLVHRQQDEGMSFGGRVVSAINQWVPLLRRTATSSSMRTRAGSQDPQQPPQEQQQ